LDRNSLLGKILRIDPRQTSSAPYSIPASNPYVGVAGADEVWLGHGRSARIDPRIGQLT
jgi:hypothetical protein